MTSRAPRLAVAIALVAALALTTSWLQARFDGSDVRKGIAAAMAHRPLPAGPSVFDVLVALGEGDPRCDGAVVSALFGDVRVRCATPGRPEVTYRFRVLLDGKRPPRAEGEAAEALLSGLAPARPGAPRGAAPRGRRRAEPPARRRAICQGVRSGPPANPLSPRAIGAP
ncbi:MAG TPA: hypothetical protein VFL83_09160 [Anaeromyxobacter sp.]|nr:hypothetical protein [Anaeromyxobacter sp.]